MCAQQPHAPGNSGRLVSGAESSSDPVLGLVRIQFCSGSDPVLERIPYIKLESNIGRRIHAVTPQGFGNLFLTSTRTLNLATQAFREYGLTESIWN